MPLTIFCLGASHGSLMCLGDKVYPLKSHLGLCWVPLVALVQGLTSQKFDQKITPYILVYVCFKFYRMYHDFYLFSANIWQGPDPLIRGWNVSKCDCFSLKSSLKCASLPCMLCPMHSWGSGMRTSNHPRFSLILLDQGGECFLGLLKALELARP